MATIKELEEDELTLARKEIATHKEANEKLSAELILVRKELVFQDEEKGKRAAELGIAKIEPAHQDEEKVKRAEELMIANKELAFQKEEKGKRAAELGIADKELAYQDEEKGKRAEELGVANKKLVFENKEKEKRAAELDLANKELAFQDEEKGKRAAELNIANIELAFQNDEKKKRAEELTIANKELAFQNDEKEKRATEKEKRAVELGIANKELAFENKEKEKRAAELSIANIELAFQNDEKEKRAAELSIANIELAFQNDEKEKRAAELIIANYARSLIEASLDPLVTISATGKILDVNEASVKVTGVTREKLIDTDFWNYFTEPTKAQEGYRRVFEKGFVADYPLTIKHKNGNLTDVLYNASVYKDDKGNVLGVFAAARDITEQKKSSQYARSLIEASLDPFVTISATGKILDVNEASVKVTGVPREKLIDTDFSNYFTDPTKAEEGYRRVFEKGFVADYPLTIKHKNGNLTDVLYNASVYKDDKGNVLGVFAAARDVKQQKWAKDLRIANKELAFQNAEKEKRAAELGIANKELIFQNDEKEKRAAELSVANIKLVFENEEKEKRAAELIIANKELAFQNEEKEKRAAELIIANQQLQQAGEALQMQEIIKLSEKNFRQLADLMPQIVWTSAPDGTIDYFNKKWFEYIGFENAGNNLGWVSLLHADDVEQWHKTFNKAVKNANSYEIEFRIIDHKYPGVYRWFLCRSLPIKDNEANITRWIGTCTDINDAKSIQEKLQHTEQLRADFIKMVSHELKTPVTSIKGYVQLLMMIIKEEGPERFPEQVSNSLKRIDYQVSRLTRLITEILDLSRIETGRLELKNEILSLTGLVKEAIEDIGLTQPKHIIKLHPYFDCNIFGDKSRIEQVVINLITNAIKYSVNSNKIDVCIREAENNKVAVSIKDYGIGIDKTEHTKIFDRFYRVEGKVEQTFAGFGIGLFIANEIIERHNGFIGVQSQKGEGSEFTFTLPVANKNTV